ncbi:hypothetical protein E2C01_041948 [Portunus trituberculatus]|uniref:Uncharacterized protein n=1 Tax=Portunus trituberculatus TaxID=210409 RepID=A0A5B7FKI5_PORTR|nr:hypothetical protein [Portunus trituberculatus]
MTWFADVLFNFPWWDEVVFLECVLVCPGYGRHKLAHVNVVDRKRPSVCVGHGGVGGNKAPRPAHATLLTHAHTPVDTQAHFRRMKGRSGAFNTFAQFFL